MYRLAISWALCSVLALYLAPAVQAHVTLNDGKGYKLVDNYKMSNFFDRFHFFTYPDPTNGFVQYVDKKTAVKNGLIKHLKDANASESRNDRVRIGVDHTNYYDPKGPGRQSVRLESKKAYTRGLFVLSLDHMPHGCGTWPAFWTYGPRWPFTGEIDIIEGVNRNKFNLMSLHTAGGCSIAGARQVGELVTSSCNSLTENVGCGVLRNKTDSYGAGFNKEGGGVYAMEWTASHIKIWKWRHHHVPKSVKKGKPDPSADFGLPLANLAGSCDINKHFQDHTITFDITFCGDYAGGQYGQSGCPLSSRGGLGCTSYVASNPSAFKNAFWSIRDLRVYQTNGSEVTHYNPPNYSSVVPIVSTRPSYATSLLPPPMGHSTKVTKTSSNHKTSTKSSKSATKTSSTKKSSKSSTSEPTGSSIATVTNLPTATRSDFSASFTGATSVATGQSSKKSSTSHTKRPVSSLLHHHKPTKTAASSTETKHPLGSLLHPHKPTKTADASTRTKHPLASLLHPHGQTESPTSTAAHKPLGQIIPGHHKLQQKHSKDSKKGHHEFLGKHHHKGSQAEHREGSEAAYREGSKKEHHA